MKKINLLLLAVGGALILSLSSCDDCKDVTCENGGTCNEGECECTDNYFGDNCETHCVNGAYAGGSCDCDAGYEGDACETMSRDKFVGSYSVSDNCTGSGADTYTVAIATSSGEVTDVLISNFWALFTNSVKATISGNTITIDSQEPDGDGWLVTGNGTYADGSITFTYSITSPDAAVDNCSATWEKQ